jgi:hypothetical protein
MIVGMLYLKGAQKVCIRISGWALRVVYTRVHPASAPCRDNACEQGA